MKNQRLRNQERRRLQSKMAILRISDAKKLSDKERKERLSDLRMELTKALSKSSQNKGKTKELKRAISRLLTLNNSHKGELSKH